MPLLEDVLPPEFKSGRYDSTEAFRLRRRPVVAMKLATGAPCESHAELFAPWPGLDHYVNRWYILNNHKAVVVNEDSVAGLSLPVVDHWG